MSVDDADLEIGAPSWSFLKEDMQYGFVIDNRVCIGCHACTVACKAEHLVPIGVNRTWVKYIEKGEFPNVSRAFQVSRCNHCKDAPCVSICPTDSLFTREDGIVDFDNRRCIGCKSCTQACPYDAIFIDPSSDTAGKCNFCAHRIDQDLNPSCVNVCPEQAIRFGDLEDPQSTVSQMISRENATVRKAEKGTMPSLYYIDGDRANLDPSATATSSTTMWSDQSVGVGHNQGVDFQQVDLLGILRKAQATGGHDGSEKAELTGLLRELETATGSEKVRRAYDQPDKGIQWGWEVAAYIFTKALAAGLVFVPALLVIVSQWFDGRIPSSSSFRNMAGWAGLVSLGFLGATGGLLVKDLDQPKRFLYVLLRPSWSSWLVRGAYIITAFGALATFWTIACFAGWYHVMDVLAWPLVALSLAAAGYTAFLFGQCKGRDFWQSPGLVVHMLVHAPLAGTAALALGGIWNAWIQEILGFSVAISLIVILAEFFGKHPSKDSAATAKSIRTGRAGLYFYGAVLGVGHVIPLLLTFFATRKEGWGVVAGICVLIGMAFCEYLWVYMPQRRSNV